MFCVKLKVRQIELVQSENNAFFFTLDFLNCFHPFIMDDSPGSLKLNLFHLLLKLVNYQSIIIISDSVDSFKLTFISLKLFFSPYLVLLSLFLLMLVLLVLFLFRKFISDMGLLILAYSSNRLLKMFFLLYL